MDGHMELQKRENREGKAQKNREIESLVYFSPIWAEKGEILWDMVSLMGTENSIKELSIDSGEWSKQENTLNGQTRKYL
jgi:hypothetical protein